MPASIHTRLRVRNIWANVGIWALALVATAVTSIAIVVSGNSNPVGGLGITAAVVGAVWFLWPRTANNTPRTITVLLLALYFSTLLPSSLSAAVQLLALATGFIAWIAQPSAHRRGTAAVVISALILVAWAVLMLHPNVPSLNVGLLGFRKSALCVAGVALGAAVPARLVPAVEMTVIRVTLLAVGASIAIHLLAPQIEQLVARSANEYTSEYGGQARLQGIFAGPFHVAFAGLLLLAWGLVRWSRYRVLAATSLIVAAAALSLALVRTAFVAAAIVAVVWAIFSPNTGKAFRRFILLLGGGILVVSIWVSTNPNASLFLQSILNVEEDTRYQGRLPGYQNGIDLFFESPIVGWGAGSAGDTLGVYFLGGLNHITSHNIVLKIAVEGGLTGLALWLALFIALFSATARRSSERTLIATTLAALVGLGIAVASTETLPVSFIAFMLVGLQLRGRKPPANESVVDDDTPSKVTLPTARHGA